MNNAEGATRRPHEFDTARPDRPNFAWVVLELHPKFEQERRAVGGSDVRPTRTGIYRGFNLSACSGSCAARWRSSLVVFEAQNAVSDAVIFENAKEAANTANDSLRSAIVCRNAIGAAPLVHLALQFVQIFLRDAEASPISMHARAYAANSSSNAFASFRSRVSKPSVNQP
jgi:hypothetical protein